MAGLFYRGGPLFMGILSILLLIMLALAVYRAIKINRNQIGHRTTFRFRLNRIKSVGLLALVVGILGQLIGLYQAFLVMEQASAIAPALLAGGLRVSMITTLYGVIIFLLSYIIWLGLNSIMDAAPPDRKNHH